MFEWIKKFCGKKLEKQAEPVRKKVDSTVIRLRIENLGWKITEIPIKKSSPDPAKRQIYQWKLIAAKGVYSHEVYGKTKDEAMKNIGLNLGVIPQE